MLKKRIIPCLDIKDGRTVKGVNFVDLIDAGDPVELAKSYVDQGADELVFLDITATIENRKTLLVLVERISKEINIPFTVGGGISTIVDVSQLIQSGADKVSVNSAAVRRPELITEIAETYGSQCCVVAIDTKNHDSTNEVFINGGRKPTGLDTRSWASEVAKLGAGEILLTSMNRDGSKIGFDHEITSSVASSVNIPVIASGGAGTIQHFSDVFTLTTATGALAASIFHYGEVHINELKQDLNNKGIPIR